MRSEKHNKTQLSRVSSVNSKRFVPSVCIRLVCTSVLAFTSAASAEKKMQLGVTLLHGKSSPAAASI